MESEFAEIFRPKEETGTGVLVLAGSSGRVDTQRARILAQSGALALPLRWFGSKGLQPGPWEVPIETFSRALDALAPEVDRLTIVGSSFGAEAALVTASLDSRVDSVAAFAPSSMVWAGYDESKKRYTSHWTFGGTPLPYLPLVAPMAPIEGRRPSFLARYEESLAAASIEELERATICVERIPELLLVGGEDDQVWPAVHFAAGIVERRTQHGLKTTSVTSRKAGHRTILPGEEPAPAGRAMQRGGSHAADAELGARAWSKLTQLLQLLE